MDIKTLSYFKELANCGSYSRAARNCFISAQGLWSAIHSLEQETGASLIRKTDAGIRLTEAGERFAEFSTLVLKEYASLTQDLSAISRKSSSRLAVSFVIGSFGIFDMSFIHRFQESHPGVILTYRQGTDLATDHWLEEGDCTLAITRAPYGEDFQTEEVAAMPLYLWVHQENPLAAKSSLTLEDLKDQQVISVGHDYKDVGRMERACQEKGFEISYLVISEERHLALSYVAKNRGVSPALPYENEQLRSIPVVGIPFSDYQEHFGVSWRKDHVLTKEEKEFLQAVKDASLYPPV